MSYAVGVGVFFVFILSFYPFGMLAGGMVLLVAILTGGHAIADDTQGYRGILGHGIHGVPRDTLWLDTKTPVTYTGSRSIHQCMMRVLGMITLGILLLLYRMLLLFLLFLLLFQMLD